MALQDKALLANLTIRQWSGRKLDKQATNTVETTYTTKGKVGNYTKKLLPHMAELQVITSTSGSIRQWFYEQTLPWMADGSRILSSQNYLDFTKAFRGKQSHFQTVVDDFFKAYPNAKAEASTKLSGLFRDSDYPSLFQLSKAFECNMTFFPIPNVNDFRIQLSDAEKESFTRHAQEAEARAMKDCWQRLYEVVNHAASKLRDPEAQLRESLIDNILKTCELLPKLNITQDPNLEAMRSSLEGFVANITVETCRNNAEIKECVATTLSSAVDAITAKMGGFYGSN